MRMECSRTSLLEAINRVRPAVAARTTKEVLMNVKAILDGSTLTLTAYDMEVGIRYELDGATNFRNGSCILMVAKLAKILSESTDEIVSITADENEVLVKIGKNKFTMPACPVDEFPDLPLFDGNGCCHDIDAGELKTLIRRTKFAAERKDNSVKYSLSGVLWEAEENSVRLTATDTKRLATLSAKAVIHAGEGAGVAKSAILPLKAINILETNLPNDGESVRAFIRTTGAMFCFGRFTLFTAIVQGKFPPTRKIIDKSKEENTTTFSIPVPQFATCIRQAAIMTDEESCRVDVDFQTGSVTMKARGEKTGASEVEMELPEYMGATIKTSYDPDYVSSFLKTIAEHATIEARLSSGIKPTLFTTSDGGEYLIMPLTGEA